MALQCDNCGTELTDDAAYCPKCGDRIDRRSEVADGDPPRASAADAIPATGAGDKLREKVQASRDAADDEEQDLWEGGYSPKAMIGHWLGAAVVSVLMLVGMFAFQPLRENGWAWLVLVVLLALLWGGLATLLAIRKWGFHYELTSQRFIHRTGILQRTTDRIEVIDMDDVTFQQGLVERMMGVGSIKIISSDRTHPELHLLGIDDVQNVADLIDTARRRERRRRGLHIESI